MRRVHTSIDQATGERLDALCALFDTTMSDLLRTAISIMVQNPERSLEHLSDRLIARYGMPSAEHQAAAEAMLRSYDQYTLPEMIDTAGSSSRRPDKLCPR